MENALKVHSLSISYDEDSGKFTLDGTATMDKQTIKEIFSAHVLDDGNLEFLIKRRSKEIN